MKDDEATLVAFLEGTLAPEEAQEFDAHLLDCKTCWVALREDRAGRAALESLRELAPSELRDRVCLAVETVSGAISRQRAHRWETRRRTRALAGVAAGVATIVVATGIRLHTTRDAIRPGVADPPPVAAVVELAQLGGAAPAAPAVEPGAGTASRSTVELNGHTMQLARHFVDGTGVLVAISEDAFHPPGTHPPGDERDSPWLARRGDVGLACFSRPVHMLIAGRLPPSRLAEIGPLLFPR